MTTHMMGTREEWLAARLDWLAEPMARRSCVHERIRARRGAVYHTEFYSVAGRRS